MDVDLLAAFCHCRNMLNQIESQFSLTREVLSARGAQKQTPMIKWPQALAPLLALTMFAGLPVSAEELEVVTPESVGLSAAKIAEINDVVKEQVEEHSTAGAVVVVLRRGKIAHFSTNGWQEIDKEKPMRKDTLFRIHSMSKPITTVAAMILWEEGLFKLDDPVSNYLPELKDLRVYTSGEGDNAKFEPAKREMTVRDLMRHTSGLTYGGDDTEVDRLYKTADLSGRGLSLEEFVHELGKLPLKYQPGTRFEYSYSIDVLGRLVEVWSKQSLDQFFAARIFKPLDMKDTAFAVPDSAIDRFAAEYGPEQGGGLKVIDPPETSKYRSMPASLSGGGGLVSTARDYARFCQMLLGEGTLFDTRLLKPKTVSLMMSNHIPDDGLPIVLRGIPRVGWGFGLGFAIRVGSGQSAAEAEEVDAPLEECRWGGSSSTHFWLLPKEDLGVIVLQQYRPFMRVLETKIKPIVYEAIEE